jgi:hypothetical protein
MLNPVEIMIPNLPSRWHEGNPAESNVGFESRKEVQGIFVAISM